MVGARVRTPIEVADVESIRVFAQEGDDYVRSSIGQASDERQVSSTIDGGPGDDILVGGPAVDAIFGGDGADAIFGNRGDDFLFADVDAAGRIVSQAGDVVFGNLGTGNDVGDRDQGVVLVPTNTRDTDHIDEVENILEEGAQKGVWSWRTATFAELGLTQNADGTAQSQEITDLVNDALMAVDPDADSAVQPIQEVAMQVPTSTATDFAVMDVTANILLSVTSFRLRLI